jgi:hypothetical protein
MVVLNSGEASACYNGWPRPVQASESTLPDSVVNEVAPPLTSEHLSNLAAPTMCIAQIRQSAFLLPGALTASTRMPRGFTVPGRGDYRRCRNRMLGSFRSAAGRVSKPR